MSDDNNEGSNVGSSDVNDELATLQDPNRTVMCTKLNRELPALLVPPLFGKIGKLVFDVVSAEAWLEWVEMQLKIVNEYHLDLSEKEHRKVLEGQLRTFLQLDALDDDKKSTGKNDALAIGTES